MGLDPDYVAMLGYVTVSITQATAEAERVRFQHVGALMATFGETRVADFSNIVPEILETWLPPAVTIPGVRPGTTSVVVDNTDTAIIFMSADIFLYDIRAMESTPIDLLVAARGGV